MNQKIQALHDKATNLAGIYASCEAELIPVLQEFDSCRGYLHFGATSLFDYCTKVLKLSDSTAYNLITVSRKAREVPELQMAVQKGELSISKARKIVSVLDQSNHGEWLALAKCSTSREIEKAVASVKPQSIVKETIKYKTDDRLELKLGISETLSKDLARVRDLESQRLGKAVSNEDALAAMVELYLERNDPVRKAARFIGKKAAQVAATHTETDSTKNGQPVPGQVLRKPALKSVENAVMRFNQRQLTVRRFGRAPVPAAIKHQVALRDRGQCTHSINGVRCTNSRWLEVHHILPVARGGDNSLANLTTLCSAHHRMHH